jgi:hypothetical protein
MKYSFLIPYISTRHRELRETLNSFDLYYKDRTDYEVCLVASEYKNPCVAFNRAALMATGEYLILTSPECKHSSNILSGLDYEFNKNKNCYIVCACEAINGNGHIMWYQHSLFNNRMLHFCTAISKTNWQRVNGFCEQYKYGVGFDDDDWLERVKKERFPIIIRDDLVVQHIEHDRTYQEITLVEKNKNLYNLLWNKQREV